MSKVKIAEKKIKRAKHKKEVDPDEGLELRDEIKERLRNPDKEFVSAEEVYRRLGLK